MVFCFVESDKYVLVSVRLERFMLKGQILKTIEECREEDVHLEVSGEKSDSAVVGTAQRMVHWHKVIATITHVPLERLPCYFWRKSM